MDADAIFSNAQYEEAFWERSPFCKAIIDTEGHLSRTNPAWSRLLGYSSSELTGLHWAEITHPADIEDARKEFGRLSASTSARGFSMVLRLIAKAGGSVWLELHVSPVRESGGALRELAVSAIPLPNYGSFKVEQAGDGYAVRPTVRWIDLVRDNPRESIVVVLLLLSLSGQFPFENLIDIIRMIFLKP